MFSCGVSSDAGPTAVPPSETNPAAPPATAGHDRPHHSHCENCGVLLAGPYCHRCGQHDFEFHRSFRHVFLDALENLFHFDSKLFRDTVTLIFRPGRLTADFNNGKRAAQMPPFRLYLFFSFLYFAIKLLDVTPAAAVAAPAGPTTAAAPGLDLGGTRITLNERNDTAFNRFMSEQGRRAFAHPQELKEAFVHAIPKMLLLGLPLFALGTRFLFRQAGQVYLQHLVVALHFHTFLYLFLMFRAGWIGLCRAVHLPLVPDLLSIVAGVWLVLYPFLMFRRLFGQSWVRTFLKTGLLGGLYAASLGAIFLGAALLILLEF